MRACIIRGSAQIGGSCLQLETAGARLLLDLGLPLESEPSPSALPAVNLANPDLLGVIVSHSHPDHYGLLEFLPDTVPIYMGEATARILTEASFFTPLGLRRPVEAFLVNRTPLKIGPFAVTPYLVDHSAFDAYALLVEADGRRLFYSGDLRLHGRKGRAMESLMANPPERVDALVMEGTAMSRPPAAVDAIQSEVDVENRLVSALTKTTGAGLIFFSPQNIDRLVSVYRAARRSSRSLVIDLYGAAVAAATARESIPQAGWAGVRVYVPQAQRIRVKRSGEFGRVRGLGTARIYLDEIVENPANWVIISRRSMLDELERGGCLRDARAFWMMWPGYLRGDGESLAARLLASGIELEVVHASGHGSVADLRRFGTALAAGKVVPMHTDRPDRYSEFFANVEVKGDGEWWDV